MKAFSVLISTLTMGLIAGTAFAQSVGIGTGPAASLTNRIGAAVAKVVADGSGLKTRAVPHTSNSAHVPLTDKGTLSFGVNTTQQISAATAGTDQFKGRATKNFVIAGRLVPLPVGVIVKKSSPYRTLQDLKGKRFSVGFTAQKTVLFILNAHFNNAGMNIKDFKGVPVPNTSSGAQLFLKGQLDGTISSLGGARLRRANAKVGGIRILGLDNSSGGLAALQKGYANSYMVQLKPGKKAIGVEKPIWVMAFDVVLMSSTKTSSDVVYRAIKALHGGKAGLVKISPGFRRFKPTNMIPDYKGVGFHPGAIKFYKEAGLWKKG